MTDETRKADESLPTVSFPRLWHVGTFDPALKRPGSLEGACLSVSRHPAAWREISDGHVSGDCWSAEASTVPLLDAHGLDAPMRAAVLAWGASKDLCEPATAWRAEWWDDELNAPVHCLLPSRIEALEEARNHDDEADEGVVEVHGHRSTPKLDALALARRPTLGEDDVVDLLLPLWTEALTDLAGVWWSDRHDPLAWSAPRGGILPARLDRLAFAPCEDEPYDDSDHEDENEA